MGETPKPTPENAPKGESWTGENIETECHPSVGDILRITLNDGDQFDFLFTAGVAGGRDPREFLGIPHYDASKSKDEQEHTRISVTEMQNVIKIGRNEKEGQVGSL